MYSYSELEDSEIKEGSVQQPVPYRACSTIQLYSEQAFH
jgi:hypothetical protein